MNKQEYINFSLDKGLKVVIDLKRDAYPKFSAPMNWNYSTYTAMIVDKVPFLPVCRPLSDLTNPIEHKGEIITVRDEIEKIRKGVLVYKPLTAVLPLNLDFDTEDYGQTIDLYDGFLIVQLLIRYHFDIAGLIEKGEAVDVNTLEINPYK